MLNCIGQVHDTCAKRSRVSWIFFACRREGGCLLRVVLVGIGTGAGREWDGGCDCGEG
jgi:hypothetical protein